MSGNPENSNEDANGNIRLQNRVSTNSFTDLSGMYKFALREIIESKRHFAKIQLIIFYFRYKKLKKIPFKELNSININKQISPELKILKDIWKPENLSKKLRFLLGKEEKFSQLIDCISYSIIPSLFCMFLEEETFELFTPFIQNLNKNKGDAFNLQKLFSRPLFVSPHFLRFTRQVFYPLLRPFYANNLTFNAEQHVEKLREQIIKSIYANIDFCPLYIHQFLSKIQSDDQLLKGVMKESFFDSLIEFPALFQTIDPWLINSPQENSKIIEILKATIDDGFIQKVTNIFIDPKSFEGRVFSFEEMFAFIQDNKIIDNIDKFVTKKFERYSLNNITDPEKNIIDEIVEKKFESYELYNFKFDHEIQNTSQYERTTIKNDSKESFHDFDRTTILLNILLTQDIQVAPSIPDGVYKLIKSKYVSDFFHFATDFRQKSKLIVGNYGFGIILMQRYFSKIKFNSYMIYRSDLKKYDDLINNYLMIHFKEVAQFVIERINRSNSKLKPFISEIIDGLGDALNDDSIRLRNIFLENNDPISKLLYMKRIISNKMFFAVLKNKVDTDELTFDDYTCIYLLIFAYTNPRRMVSNLVFISEFFFDKVSISLTNLRDEFYANFVSTLSLLSTCVDFFIDFNQLKRFSIDHGSQDSSSFLENRKNDIKMFRIYFKILLNEKIDSKEKKLLHAQL